MAALNDVLPPARVRHVLRGPVGDATDAAVCALLNAGLTVERVKSGTTYRIEGDAEIIATAVRTLDDGANRGAGVSLIRERPGDPVTLLPLIAPASALRRTTIVDGAGSAPYVARALDRGLSVAAVGDGRFAVTGPSRVQLEWIAADVFRCSWAEALERMNTTEAALAAEELPMVPPVLVTLPPRVSKTTVTYDQETGQIAASETVEKDLPQ